MIWLSFPCPGYDMTVITPIPTPPLSSSKECVCTTFIDSDTGDMFVLQQLYKDSKYLISMF